MEQIDAIQLSRKGLLKTAQQTREVAENKKRQRGFEGTTEEVESACESFRKPSKLLRTTGPVASSSALQLDTPGPVASSSAMRLDTDATDAPESSRDEPVPDHPADDNEVEDDEANRKVFYIFSSERLAHHGVHTGVKGPARPIYSRSVQTKKSTSP